MNIEEQLKRMETEDGFFKHNNYHIHSINEKKVVLRADLTQNSNNPYGYVHGGLIFGLTDTVMGMLAAAGGKKAVTIDSNISYLKPGNGKYLIAEAEIIKAGKKICFLNSQVFNDKEELIATANSTYYYVK